MGNGGGEGLMGEAAARGTGLDGVVELRDGEVGNFCGEFGELRENGLGLEVAGENEKGIGGAIALGVIVDHLGMSDGIEAVEVPDDGELAVVLLISSAEEKLGGDAVGIVEAHVDFAADDVFLGLEVFEGEGGEEDELGEGLEEKLGRGVGAVDVVDGAVEGGVGVPVAAFFLHGLGQSGTVEGLGAFKDHVLQEGGRCRRRRVGALFGSRLRSRFGRRLRERWHWDQG